MNKNCVILCIQLGGKFINLDGQDYDTFGATQYTGEEAIARVAELKAEDVATDTADTIYRIIFFK